MRSCTLALHGGCAERQPYSLSRHGQHLVPGAQHGVQRRGDGVRAAHELHAHEGRLRAHDLGHHLQGGDDGQHIMIGGNGVWANRQGRIAVSQSLATIMAAMMDPCPFAP